MAVLSNEPDEWDVADNAVKYETRRGWILFPFMRIFAVQTVNVLTFQFSSVTQNHFLGAE